MLAQRSFRRPVRIRLTPPGYAMTLLTVDPVDESDGEDIGIEDAFERYNRWN